MLFRSDTINSATNDNTLTSDYYNDNTQSNNNQTTIFVLSTVGVIVMVLGFIVFLMKKSNYQG